MKKRCYQAFDISKPIPSIKIYKVFAFWSDSHKYFSQIQGSYSKVESSFKHKMKIPYQVYTLQENVVIVTNLETKKNSFYRNQFRYYFIN